MSDSAVKEFLTFLTDNFKGELYRDDAKSIIKKLKDPSWLENNKIDNWEVRDMVKDNLFLYSIFLLTLETNILPYLDNANSYNKEIFAKNPFSNSSSYSKTLKTFIISGDRKTVDSGFLDSGNRNLGIEKIIIEEGVETVEFEAFLNLPNLREIYLPASLKHFGDVKLTNGSQDLTVYYKPVLKANGKRGLGISIQALGSKRQAWYTNPDNLKKW